MELGTFNIFFNRKKFKDFSVMVNDFKTTYPVSEKSKYLRKIDLYDIIKKNSRENKITIENWNYKQGNVSLYELYCISSIANYFKPAEIFEIGTFDGNTTQHLALNTPHTTHINTLDIPPGELQNTTLKLDEGDAQLIDKKVFKIGQCFINGPVSGKITQLLSDSAKFDYSDFVNKINLFFVDGAHSYEYIEIDTQNAFKSITDNGIILWHDYGNILNVTEYLNNLSKSKPLYRIEFTSIVIFAPALFST